MVPGNTVVEELLRSDLVDDPSRHASREPDLGAATKRRRLEWSRDASLAAVALGGLALAGRRARRRPGPNQTSPG